MVFPVTSSLAGPSGYPGPQAVVRRRFKDVVALAELLQVGGAREGGDTEEGARGRGHHVIERTGRELTRII